MISPLQAYSPPPKLQALLSLIVQFPDGDFAIGETTAETKKLQVIDVGGNYIPDERDSKNTALKKASFERVSLRFITTESALLFRRPRRRGKLELERGPTA